MNGPPLSVGDDSVAFGEGDDGDFAEGAIDYGTGAEDYMRGDADGSGFGSHKRKRGHQQQVLVDFRPRPTDYLQAFSHFSYAYSERKMLVCDLQGVKSQSSPDNPACAGVFELTGESFPVLLCRLFYLFLQGRLQARGLFVFLSLL